MDIAENVNRIAEIIRDANIKDVAIVGYDMSIESNPLPREVSEMAVMLNRKLCHRIYS